MLWRVLLALPFLLAVAAPRAQAVSIDFRSLPFDISAKNQASFTATVAGVGDVTLSALPSGSTLWWDAVDGFGVQHSYEADEVEADEILRLSFAAPVDLTGIHLTDLFNESGYLETGAYALDGGTPVWFAADPGQTTGTSNGVRNLVPAGGHALVSYIDFTAPGLTGCDVFGGNCQNHEYSLSGVDVNPLQVPEPATLLLTGAGLAGMALWRRRRPA